MKARLSLKPNVIKHVGYWVVFILFFTFVWGTYDHDYARNFYIQIFSLPARLTLVYTTLFFLLPRTLLKKQYLSFILSYLLTLVGVSVLIQRPMMMYYIQPNFLTQWNNENFFAVSEIMNTILDVNLSAIIPCGYVFFKMWVRSEQQVKKLRERTIEKSDCLYIKVEKTLQKISLTDIIYIEALKNYVRIKTTERDIVAYRSIKSIEDELPKAKFLRVHRSFIVSIDFIDNFSPSRLEIKGDTIPVGRKYKEEAKKSLGYF